MKKLLIIIDMQEGFNSVESKAIVPRIKKLLDFFKGEKVFSLFVDEPNSPFERLIGWKKFQDKNNQQLLEPLRSYSLPQFLHKGYTVLTSELLQFVRSSHFTNIYLCGVYTDVCIIKAAMDLFEKNISVKVIEDAPASLHGINSHNQAIDSMKHIIGKTNVVKISDII